LAVIGGAVPLGQMVELVVQQLIQPLVEVLLIQAQAPLHQFKLHIDSERTDY